MWLTPKLARHHKHVRTSLHPPTHLWSTSPLFTYPPPPSDPGVFSASTGVSGILPICPLPLVPAPYASLPDGGIIAIPAASSDCHGRCVCVCVCGVIEKREHLTIAPCDKSPNCQLRRFNGAAVNTPTKPSFPPSFSSTSFLPHPPCLVLPQTPPPSHQEENERPRKV